MVDLVSLQGNFQSPKDYSASDCRKLDICGGVGCPPPIIFERLKLPQQIIYHRKGNLSETPNHLEYWQNILISRSSRNLGHFWKFEKFQTLRTQTHHVSFWSRWSGDSKYIICFAKYLNFAKIKAIMCFTKFLNAFVNREIWIFREPNYIFGISRSSASKWCMIYLCSKSEIFSSIQNGLKSDYFAKLGHKIPKSNYFSRYLKWFRLLDKFPFRRYIICWANLIWKLLVGAPRTAASFYSAKLCSSLYQGLLYRDSTVCNFALLKRKGEG